MLAFLMFQVDTQLEKHPDTQSEYEKTVQMNRTMTVNIAIHEMKPKISYAHLLS